MKQFYTLLILIFTFSTTILAQGIVVVKDADVGAGVTNWTSNNTYHLDGYVFVEDGGVLNIEAGTVIKGLGTPTTGHVSSALIVARGAQIFAEGTEEDPIIFTAELDDVNVPDDLEKSDRGLWGGVIVLGNGIVGVDGGVQNVEGIPSTEGKAQYGGTDNEDNSGVLRYVSIRHGGSKLEANNEINGLTLAGVGNGTEIDYVEVFANLDDGIEWFGGSVKVKHAVTAFCGDDCFDYDQSWDGAGQFWFAVQDEEGNNGGEWDGSEAANLEPKVSPVISNATFIGGGDATVNGDGNPALRIRDDAAAQVHNSIFTGYVGQAIILDNDSGQDSYQRFVDGDISFNNNIFFDFVPGSDFASIITTDGGDDNLLINHLNTNNNTIEDPVLAGISRTNDKGLDPRISKGSPALGGARLISDDYFDPVPYRGAFSNDDNWAAGWTALDQMGFFGDLVEPADVQVVVFRDQDIEAGEKVTWTADRQYVIDGYVFVEDGACLTINPGTVVKAKASPSTGDKTSALIISRGGMILADGRSDAPIIFTAEFDDLEDSSDLTKDDRGLWGGLIILGKGVVGVDGGTSNVEGVPSTEGRAEYGGADNDDNSGILRYVSIRHGGDKLEANNEINGLTLAGVGRGTTIDYIDVYANLDDGIEWFGGAVDVKHAVVAFCGDDSFDWDQSWDGRGQYWFAIQDEEGNNAGEWDGSEASNLEPKVSPTISNMTLIGPGDATVNGDGNHALRIRDDAAVHVYNTVFSSFVGDAIILDNDSGQDSWQRFLAGDITFTNNVFFDFASGEDLLSIINSDGGGDSMLSDHLVNNGNKYANPGLAGICYEPNACLDPRVNGSGSAWNVGGPVNGDPFFDNAQNIGAFPSSDNWAADWTGLAHAGYFGDLVSSVDDPALSEVDEMMRIYPNPASDICTVEFELHSSMNITISIVDIMGRTLYSPNSKTQFGEGKYRVDVPVSQLSKGTYLVILSTKGNILGRRVFIKN